MPTIPHVEKHFTATQTVRNVVIVMADGLSVCARGRPIGRREQHQSSCHRRHGGNHAGAIAMGLGRYLAARTDAEHYDAEVAREQSEIDSLRGRELFEIEDILQGYGLEGDSLKSVVSAITSDRKRWIDFMLRLALNGRVYSGNGATLPVFR